MENSLPGGGPPGHLRAGTPHDRSLTMIANIKSTVASCFIVGTPGYMRSPLPESRKPYEPAPSGRDTMSPRRDTMSPRDEWRLYP